MSALLWVSIIKIIIYRHYQLKTLPMYIRLLLNFTGKHSACMSDTAYACIMRYKRCVII